MLSRIILLVGCFTFSSMAFAACTTMYNGRVVCGNGETARSYNPNTGTAVRAQTNPYNGVTHTETNRGGEAYTRNGKGVVQTPSGKTCARGRYNSGCN